MLGETKISSRKEKYQRFMKEMGVGFVAAVRKDVQKKIDDVKVGYKCQG